MGGIGATILLWVHALHLFMPEILGFVDSLAAVGIGFTALGIAVSGTLDEIGANTGVLIHAGDAIQNAIPGTTQWTAAIKNLGEAYSQMPTDTESATQSIVKFIDTVENGTFGGET